jgi:predicted RNA-binding protein with PIN domain
VDSAALFLTERLAVLHDVDSCEVTIVFDGKGERVELLRHGGEAAPCVIYAPAGVSADAIIEQIVSRAPDADDFTVASRDNALCLSVYARGAHVISPDELLDMVKREQRAMGKDLRWRKQQSDRDFGNRMSF